MRPVTQVALAAVNKASIIFNSPIWQKGKESKNAPNKTIIM